MGRINTSTLQLNSAAITEKLAAAIEKNDLTSADQLSTILKNMEDASKANIDATNARRVAVSENLRFWIPVLVPFIGSIALVLAFFLQSKQVNQSADQFRRSTDIQAEQFKKTAQIQADSREDTEWRSVLEMAKDTRGPQGVFGLALLKSFLEPTSRYARSARDISVVMLGHMSDPNEFDVLFPTIAHQTSWSNLNDLPTISRQLEVGYDMANDLSASRQVAAQNAKDRSQAMSRYYEQMAKYQTSKQIYEARIKANPHLAETLFPPAIPLRPRSEVAGDFSFTSGLGRSDGASDFAMSPETIMTNVNKMQQRVAWNIVKWLKREDYPSSFRLNLDGAAFYQIDLSHLNFHGASINETWYSDCNVKDADFSSVAEYNSSRWSHTAWWRAARISPGLLAYLGTNYKYSEKYYYTDDKTASIKEYDKDLVRLKKLYQ